MSWAHPQGIKAGSATSPASLSSISAVFGSNLTNPSVIFVYVGYGTPPGVGNVSSVIDNAGNLYTKINAAVDVAASQAVEVWVAFNTQSTSANQVTVNFTSPASFVFLIVDEFTGGGSTPTIDATNNAIVGAFSPGPYVGNASLPDSNNELIYGTIIQDFLTSNNNPVTANAPFSIATVNQDTNGEWATEWFEQSLAASISPSFSWDAGSPTLSPEFILILVTVRTSATLNTNHLLSLLGAGG